MSWVFIVISWFFFWFKLASVSLELIWSNACTHIAYTSINFQLFLKSDLTIWFLIFFWGVPCSCARVFGLTLKSKIFLCTHDLVERGDDMCSYSSFVLIKDNCIYIYLDMNQVAEEFWGRGHFTFIGLLPVMYFHNPWELMCQIFPWGYSLCEVISSMLPLGLVIFFFMTLIILCCVKLDVFTSLWTTGVKLVNKEYVILRISNDCPVCCIEFVFYFYFTFIFLNWLMFLYFTSANSYFPCFSFHELSEWVQWTPHLLHTFLFRVNLIEIVKGKLMLMGLNPNQWQQLSSGVIAIKNGRKLNFGFKNPIWLLQQSQMD